MQNEDHIKALKSYIRRLKKQKITKSTIASIMRAKALIAYYEGIPLDIVARCYDFHEKTLKRFIKKFESYGCDELGDAPRSGRPVKLPPEKQEELKKMIEQENNRVWVARHIHFTLISVFGVTYSVNYLPQFLRTIGLSFHKSVHNLIKKDTEKRKKWINEQLPDIYKKKIEQGWRIFFQDEVGFQSEGTLAYTWGIKGKKTQIANYGRHGRMNLIGAFELGSGIFYGVATSFRVNAMRFRRFICHLKHEMRTDKILLICDNARFHKAKWLTEWVKEQSEWLNIEFLPPYSPDFNPIERLWRWMKTEFFHNKCWKKLDELKKHVFFVIKNMHKHAEDIKSLMKKENERFKNIFDYYAADYIKPFELGD